MRDRDRFWWVPLILGVVFSAIGVLVPFFFLKALPWGDPFMTAADYEQDIGMMAALAVFCLAAGTGFALSCVPARRRHRRRVAVLRGDMAAMPLAMVRPDQSRAPDVTRQPIELLWRLGKGAKYLHGPATVLTVLQLVLAFVSIAATLFALIGPIILPGLFAPSDAFDSPPPMSLTEVIWRITGAGAILALVIATGIFVARILPLFFGRPFGVVATATGIEERTWLATTVRMAWDEMRLLEVFNGQGTTRRAFALYAPGKRIAWVEYTAGLGTEYAPVGATKSEMILRQEALLGLIAARTGLAPRTLAKALRDRPEPARKGRRSSKAANAAVLLIVALLVAGIAAAEAFFPLTAFGWLNWASVGSLGVTAAGLVIAMLWNAMTTRELPAHVTPPPAGAPSLEAPGVIYSFSWRTPWLRRLWFVLVGLCLAINLAPGIYVMFDFVLQWILLLLPGFHFPRAFSVMELDVGKLMLAVILAALGMMGTALVYVGVAIATVRIRANQDGLSTYFGRHERLIPWSSARDISWGTSAGWQTGYLVKSDVPGVQISWPAGIQTASVLPSRDGALPIGPDELAALVAARIGKPISVRQERQRA